MRIPFENKHALGPLATMLMIATARTLADRLVIRSAAAPAGSTNWIKKNIIGQVLQLGLAASRAQDHHCCLVRSGTSTVCIELVASCLFGYTYTTPQKTATVGKGIEDETLVFNGLRGRLERGSQNNGSQD